jgi:Ca-activated chloride channel homolog
MRMIVVIGSLFFICAANAQKTAQYVEKGNANYKQKKYAIAKDQYGKALQKEPGNTIAQFNSGNASQRMNKFEESARSYEAAVSTAKDPMVKAQAYYNQGLSYIRQNKLAEAIDAFKRSLRLNADDNDTRENLQKALKELNRQQQENNDKQDNKNKKKPKDQDQQKPPKTKLSKEDADKLLNNLQKEERNLQKQVQKKSQSTRQLKDW